MNWRNYGDVTEERWRQTIESVGGPAELASSDSWQAARPHSALLLAMMGRENRWGTTQNQNPLSAKNALNMRPPLRADGTRDPGYMSFWGWAEGIAAARERITSQTYGGGIYARTTTLPELIHVFAPSSDNNDEAEYVRFVEDRFREWSVAGGEQPMKRPTVVIDAGHRSTDRSGNPAEMEMTDDLAVAYVAELRQRGYEAFWYQRDIDQDSDPDETIGDLNTVAKGLGEWLSHQGWALMISCHYNGAHSPLHAIVPDNVGLSTAYPEGRDPADTAANNPLDRQLAEEITRRMWGADLGKLFLGKLNVAGLMSETETGVGLQGYRLAVFSATCPSRMKAVRLVIEHGGTSDPAAQRFADFAKAAADAIDSVYGQEQPGPVPIWPREPLKVPDELRAQGHVLVKNSARRFRAVHGTSLRTAPSRDAPAIGKDPVRRGRVYSFAYSTLVDGEGWLVSERGSWAIASAFEPAA